MQKDQNKKSSAPVKDAAAQPAREKTNLLQLIPHFLIPFVLFTLTAPKTVTFEDSGLFLLVAKYWGIAHPPGYPLFSILGYLSTLIPISTVAFRVSMLSAVLGASSCVLLYLILKRWVSSKIVLYSIPSVFILSGTVWSQMIVAEVYALNLFLTCAFLYLLLKVQENISAKKVFLAGLMLGFGLANHWPLFLFSGMGLIFLVQREWFKSKWLKFFAAGLILGLTPYLAMYFRSQQPDLMISFLGPIPSLGDLFHYILRSYYKTGDKSVLYTWKDGALFLKYFLECLVWYDFSFLFAPLALIGIYDAIKNKGKRFSFFLGLLFLSSSFFLLFFLQLEHNDLNRNIMKVFWLIPFMAYAVLVALGADFFLRKQKTLKNFPTLAVGTILFFGFFHQLSIQYLRNDLSEDRFGELYAQAVLRSVPAGHTIVASTDGDVGPVAYTHLVLRENEAINMLTGTGVLLKDRIHDPFEQSMAVRYDSTLKYIREHDPLYSIKNLYVFDGRKNIPVSIMFNGLTYQYSYKEVVPKDIPPESMQLTKNALENYLQNYDVDNWRFHRETLASRLCNVLVLKNESNHPIFQKSEACKQVLARHKAATGAREEADKIYLDWMAGLKYPVTREKQQFYYHFMVNRLELVNSLKNQQQKQFELLNEGIQIVMPTLFEYPLCDNMVAPLLKSLEGPIQLSPGIKEQLKVFDDCNKK